MKYLVLTLLLIAPLPDINKIARTNALKKEAKTAYESGNYEEAINKYHFLLDSMNVDEEGIRMNLANAYYMSGDTANAVNNFDLLRDSENRELASRAYQQLGVIKNKQKNREEALADFKQALRKNPANEEARYNYEMLKKLLDEQQEQQDQQQQDQKNQDQNQEQDQQQQDQEQQQNQDQQKDQEGEKSDQEQEQDQQQQEGKEGDEQDQQNNQQNEQESEEKKNEGNPDEASDEENDEQNQQDQLSTSPDRFKDLKISEEKAKMILEAMKNQEVQYLQQNRRKSQQAPPSDKPDW